MFALHFYGKMDNCTAILCIFRMNEWIARGAVQVQGDWVFNPSSLAKTCLNHSLFILWSVCGFFLASWLMATSEQTGWDDTRGCVFGKYTLGSTDVFTQMYIKYVNQIINPPCFLGLHEYNHLSGGSLSFLLVSKMFNILLLMMKWFFTTWQTIQTPCGRRKKHAFQNYYIYVFGLN